MAHDLRRQHRLEHLPVHAAIGMHLPELVEGGDHAVPQHASPSSTHSSSADLRRARVNHLQHRPESRAGPRPASAGSSSVSRSVPTSPSPNPASVAGGLLGQRRLAEPLEDAADEPAFLQPAHRANRGAAPRPDPSSCNSTRRSRSNRSGSTPISRAASSRVRRASLVLLTRPSPPASARAASTFCAGPGRARNATIAARIEKSRKVAELLDALERIDVRMLGQIEQRFGADLELLVAQEPLRLSCST